MSWFDFFMSIIDNRKVYFDYYIEECYEVGFVLEGWEVKVLCVGCGQIKEGYVVVKNVEIFLIGIYISLLFEVFMYIKFDLVCMCKLLLYCEEIKKLIGKVEQCGYMFVLLNFYYKGGCVKCDIVFVKGKKLYDKCEIEKKCDWECEKVCIMCVGI